MADKKSSPSKGGGMPLGMMERLQALLLNKNDITHFSTYNLRIRFFILRMSPSMCTASRTMLILESR